MPFNGLDYAALAEKAEAEARRAPSQAIQGQWKKLASEYRNLAELRAQKRAAANSTNPS